VRIDKFLKVSRLTKRRETAKELCEDNDVSINGHPAKAMSEVHEGDLLSIRMGKHNIVAKVLSIREFARKEEASQMFEIISDDIERKGE
jgi:ribosomal 50S subunit-recycling heat shock protein